MCIEDFSIKPKLSKEYTYGCTGEGRTLFMEKKTVSAVTLTLLLLSMLTLAFNIQPVESVPGTITVPDDFKTIQEAINAASSGDTVFVKAGIYYEHVYINKPISLIGENKDATIIDGQETGTVVQLDDVDNVTFSGFTIQNSGKTLGPYGPFYDSGIMISCSIGYHYNNVSGNVVKNSQMGIYILDSCYNTISNNQITSNSFGFYFMSWSEESDYNVISGNDVISNEYGMYILWGSYDNRIYHNNFVNNMDQVYWGSNNVWDDGYPSGGNYWSDYTGIDVKSGPNQDLPGSDGIGDTPYIVYADTPDRYPLMNPWVAPTYALTIVTTTGGTTAPAPGTYSYTANSTVQVTAIPNPNYLFHHWELESLNVGSANPYTVTMDKNHTLKAIFSHVKPSVPVGGYSFPIQVHTKTDPVLPYIALIATLTAIFTKLRPKTKRKR
jgi:parallel beta-helix repeat protein